MSPGSKIVKMLLAYRELCKSEGPVVVLLYGPNKAAVLEPDAPKVKALVASIEEEQSQRAINRGARMPNDLMGTPENVRHHTKDDDD